MKNNRFLFFGAKLVLFKVLLMLSCLNIFADYNYSFVIGRGSNYYYNDSIVSPYQVKYFSYANDMITHYLDSKIVVKTYNTSGSISKVRTFGIDFNLPNLRLLNKSNYSEDNLQTKFMGDSVTLNEFKVFKRIEYKDTINENNFILNYENNKMKIYLDFVNSKFISSFYLKFTGVDSLIKNSDSTVTINTSNGNLKIDKQLVNLIDSNGIFTNNVYIEYLVNNDTLRFSSISVDTNKSLITDEQFFIDHKKQSLLSSDVNDCKIHQFEVDNSDAKYVINSNVINNNYMPGYTSSSLTIDTVRKVELYRISKLYSISNFSKSNIFGYVFDSIGKTEFTDFKFSNFNNLTLIGFTNNPIGGLYKTVLLDSGNYIDFKAQKVNSFIMKFDFDCKLKYSNYINFVQGSNIYANSYINENYCDFIVGYVDSLTNIDSLNVGFNRSSNKNSVAFLQYYNHKKEKSKYSFISSIINGELTTFSHISSIRKQNSSPLLLITGTTNSSGTYFGTSNWNKSNQTNAVFNCIVPLFIDTIYRLTKIDGLGEEGNFNTKNDYYKNKSFSFKPNNNTYVCFLSNSNSFNNQDTSMYTNNKINDISIPTIARINDSSKVNKILYLNSDSNHTELNFEKTLGGFTIFSNTKGKVYCNSSNTLSYSDTTYSSSFTNSVVTYINDDLSLSTLNNMVVFAPKYFSFVKGNSGDIMAKSIKIYNGNLYFGCNVKSQNSFTKLNQLINGDNTLGNWDSQLTRVYLYE